MKSNIWLCPVGELCFPSYNLLFLKKYLFIWLCQVLFIAHGLSSCGTQALCGMWDLSSPTRDQTGISCIRRQILNHWTTRESPPSHLLLSESDVMVYEVDCF